MINDSTQWPVYGCFQLTEKMSRALSLVFQTSLYAFPQFILLQHLSPALLHFTPVIRPLKAPHSVWLCNHALNVWFKTHNYYHIMKCMIFWITNRWPQELTESIHAQEVLFAEWAWLRTKFVWNYEGTKCANTSCTFLHYCNSRT